MAPHSSVLAWRIPGTGEPGGLPSVGSHRVGHDWATSLSLGLTYVNIYLSNIWYVNIQYRAAIIPIVCTISSIQTGTSGDSCLIQALGSVETDVSPRTDCAKSWSYAVFREQWVSNNWSLQGYSLDSSLQLGTTLRVTVKLGRHSPWDHTAAQLFLPIILPLFFLGKIQKVVINVLVINLLRSASQGTPSRTIWKHLVHLSMYLLTVAPPIIKYKVNVIRAMLVLATSVSAN